MDTQIEKALSLCDQIAGPDESQDSLLTHRSSHEVVAILMGEVERLQELADKYKWQVRDTCKRAEAAEAELDRLQALVKRAVTYARTDDGRRVPKWAAVRDVFHHGSTVSDALCREFGFDPETGERLGQPGGTE